MSLTDRPGKKSIQAPRTLMALHQLEVVLQHHGRYPKQSTVENWLTSCILSVTQTHNGIPFRGFLRVNSSRAGKCRIIISVLAYIDISIVT